MDILFCISNSEMALKLAICDLSLYILQKSRKIVQSLLLDTIILMLEAKTSTSSLEIALEAAMQARGYRTII